MGNSLFGTLALGQAPAVPKDEPKLTASDRNESWAKALNALRQTGHTIESFQPLIKVFQGITPARARQVIEDSRADDPESQLLTNMFTVRAGNATVNETIRNGLLIAGHRGIRIPYGRYEGLPKGLGRQLDILSAVQQRPADIEDDVWFTIALGIDPKTNRDRLHQAAQIALAKGDRRNYEYLTTLSNLPSVTPTIARAFNQNQAWVRWHLQRQIAGGVTRQELALYRARWEALSEEFRQAADDLRAGKATADRLATGRESAVREGANLTELEQMFKDLSKREAAKTAGRAEHQG